MLRPSISDATNAAGVGYRRPWLGAFNAGSHPLMVLLSCFRMRICLESLATHNYASALSHLCSSRLTFRALMELTRDAAPHFHLPRRLPGLVALTVGFAE